jgi:hypothetical protein
MKVVLGGVDKSDVDDAIWVFREWVITHPLMKAKPEDLDIILKKLKAKILKTKPITIDIDDIKIHADHARRIKGKALLNPVIVCNSPLKGMPPWIILDGQHRILTLKEAGFRKVKAICVMLDWEKGPGVFVRSFQQDYIATRDSIK